MATSPSGETRAGVTLVRVASRNYIHSEEWTTGADVNGACFLLLRFAEEIKNRLAPVNQAAKRKSGIMPRAPAVPADVTSC